MMKCSDTRPLLSFLAEKETEPLETLETRRHLDNCRPCARRAEGMARLMDRFDALPEHEPPEDLTPAIMSRLREMRARLAAEHPGGLAAKWTGLAVMIGSSLAALSSSAGQTSLKTLSKPFASIAGLLSGASLFRDIDELLSGAAPALFRVATTRLGNDVVLETGSDLTITLQILATFLVLLFTLAIPVLGATAWFLRSGPGRPDSGRRP